MPEMVLVVPAAPHLDSYVRALETGWSPDSTRGKEVANQQLALIRSDPAGFLASLDDPEARGAPVELPDGSTVPRLPGVVRWMWDGAFCGMIGFRWQAGTAELPPSCLGHIGYNVVPWKRGQGHATRALSAMLDQARDLGLPWVELTTTPDNASSRHVIEANGGRLVERFAKLPAYGGGAALRFRIDL